MALVSIHDIVFAILTVSDSRAAGQGVDLSGMELARWIEMAGGFVKEQQVVSDTQTMIGRAIVSMCGSCDVVLTTGGTGLGPRDVTPEATKAVIDREVPGIAEMLRAIGLKSNQYACLSRGVAGIVGNSLVINLPGSPRAIKESMEVLLDILPHAVALLRGHTDHPEQ